MGGDRVRPIARQPPLNAVDHLLMDLSLRALNGFGLGARPGERATIGDPRGWLRAQLRAGAPIVQAPAEATPDQLTAAIEAFRMAGQGAVNDTGRAARQEARRRLTSIAAAESRQALVQRITSARPFVERLVAFWSNHLCVSTAAKVLVAPLAGRYEREAIRPHVLGRFEDLVLASATHPAMLVYLDNLQSIGPSSPAARASGRGRGTARGLNENYARELLELHTLGVDGGYTQQDVQELAKMLTGWTVGGLTPERPAARGAPGGRGVARGRGRAAAIPVEAAGAGVGFAFRPLLHEPGAKTLLGTRYDESGQAEGERAIRALARHPATARFIATKLVRHFVSDDPPPGAVDRIARRFRETGGDLALVAEALIDLPEAWTLEARKFRTPQDWVVAMLRAFDVADAGALVLPVLRQLRHPLWSPQAPKGFGDTAAEWADPDSLLNRAELARGMTRRLRLPRVDPRALADVMDIAPGDPLRRFLDDASIAVEERMALALAGPAFQWR
ncbi:MAG: DUF1800 domain-containing protein [Acidobacteria bacterium]|nr:DUF1800 domain-containing protein [Acidobacteriota bacterium]